MNQNQSNIDNLTFLAANSWKSSRLRRLSYFSPLGRFLKKDPQRDSDFSYELIKNYLASSTFNRWFFRRFIQDEIEFDKALNVAKVMQLEKVFTRENFNLIKLPSILNHFFMKLLNYWSAKKTSVNELVQDIQLLSNISNEEHFDFLIKGDRKIRLEIFQYMKSHNLLNEENFKFIKNQINIIVSHTHPLEITEALLILKDKGIQDDNIYKNLAKNSNPIAYANSMSIPKQTAIDASVQTKDLETLPEELLADQGRIKLQFACINSIQEILKSLRLDILLPPLSSDEALRLLDSLKLLQSKAIAINEETFILLMRMKDPKATAEFFVSIAHLSDFKTIMNNFTRKPEGEQTAVLGIKPVIIEDYFSSDSSEIPGNKR